MLTVVAAVLCLAGAVAPLAHAGTAPQAGTARQASTATQAGAAPQVLLIGSYHGIAGTYTTISAAAAAASPGDWILIGPGDYKARPRTAAP